MLPALAAKAPAERKSAAFQQAYKYDFAKIALLNEAFGLLKLSRKTMSSMQREDYYVAALSQKTAI